MASSGKQFLVDTRPTKKVVVDSLTRDLTDKACVFDLIDNSIDAARDTIFQKNKKASHEELPSSYAGYEVKVALSGTTFSIDDNCGGISVEQLTKMVLRFGERSSHDMGIGIFGIGLNRALFKLGRVSHLRTDTGKQRAELILNVDDYLTRPGWDLPAEEFPSSGTIGTSIEISQLDADISRNFSDKAWVEALKAEIGKRYARFISKGLVLRVNKVPVKSDEVKIREDSPYESEWKFYKTKDGVSVNVRYGQHKDHRFTAETDEYDKDRNAALTDQYGWTVLCNDRGVLLSDKTYKTGWMTKFHSEFYGFVGIVEFVSADPAKLPWSTSKTDVNLNNPAYQTALEDMRAFAEKWRTTANKRKKTKKPPRKIPPAHQPKKPKAQPEKTGTSKTSSSSKPETKEDHNQFRTILPTDISEKLIYDKHLTLVHEAKTLDLFTHSYTGLVLIRMLFEVSTILFFVRHQIFDDLKSFAVERRGKKIKLSAEEVKHLVPTLDEMVPYLDNNPQVWGAAKHSYLKHSLKRMATHLPMLNGAAHNAFQTINKAVAFEIRDEVLPLLRHLIET